MHFNFKNITSTLLAVWLILFSSFTTLHHGHTHDLMPVEQSMCDIECEQESHRKAGDSCHWFIANRILTDDGSFDKYPSELFTVYIDKIQKFLEVHYSSPEHAILSTRAPPTFSA